MGRIMDEVTKTGALITVFSATKPIAGLRPDTPIPLQLLELPIIIYNWLTLGFTQLLAFISGTSVETCRPSSYCHLFFIRYGE